VERSATSSRLAYAAQAITGAHCWSQRAPRDNRPLGRARCRYGDIVDRLIALALENEANRER